MPDWIPHFARGSHRSVCRPRASGRSPNVAGRFLFGLDPGQAAPFLASRRLRLVSDLGPADLERMYLETPEGTPLGQTLGHVRILQAEVPAV